MAKNTGGRGGRIATKTKSVKRVSTKDIILVSIIVLLIIALLVTILGKFGKTNLNLNDNKDDAYVFSESQNFLPPTFDGDILQVHFIDIGQGDAIVCMLPDGKILLIDAGSGTRVNAATRAEYNSYLKDVLNVDKIEYMIISHPDSDHVNLAEGVLDEYSVENIIYNEYYEKGSQTYRSFTEAAKKENAELEEVKSEYIDVIDGDGYKISIYAPGNGGFEGADSATNSMSIMCLLEYGGRKVLFTGDAEMETESWFMSETDAVDIDVLKVGHHGSDSCTSKEFIDYIDPEYAVISCGVNNTYRHPHAATMQTLFDNGIVTYRTDRHGNIVLYIDEDGDFGFLPENEVPVDNNRNGVDPLMLVKEAA